MLWDHLGRPLKQPLPPTGLNPDVGLPAVPGTFPESSHLSPLPNLWRKSKGLILLGEIRAD